MEQYYSFGNRSEIKIHQMNKLDGQCRYIMSVRFSPEGNTLASGSDDNSIRLWDVKTGQKIQSSDNRYNEILEKCKISLLQNNPFTGIYYFIKFSNHQYYFSVYPKL